MTENRAAASKRIAKNTMLLYVRMLFLMAVPLSDFIDGYLEKWLEALETFMSVIPAV